MLAFMPFLADAVPATVSPYITDGILVTAITRLYLELRGETKQSRDDKIAALNALNEATLALTKIADNQTKLETAVRGLADELRLKSETAAMGVRDSA